MSAAELKELRRETKKYLDRVDQDTFHLTTEQEIILAERMKKYRSGKMKFSTWEEVEKRILSKAENALL